MRAWLRLLLCPPKPRLSRPVARPGLRIAPLREVRRARPSGTRTVLPSYRCRVIAMGSNTDCYQPIEREYRITRRLLEVMAEFNQPVMLTTKSALVTRDLDILSPMAARGLAHICVSVTTLDP